MITQSVRMTRTGRTIREEKRREKKKKKKEEEEEEEGGRGRVFKADTGRGTPNRLSAVQCV